MKIFIGSSEQRKGDMMKVAQWLEKSHETIRWDDTSVFPPGQYFLPTLIKISREVDAAILIFGEDDQVWRRGESQPQTRDNVLIEYGIFTGVLGDQNTIICRVGNPIIPTNLGGLLVVDLDSPARAEQQISDWAGRLKPRITHEHQTLADLRERYSAIKRQQTRPFLSWLCDRHLVTTHLKSTSKAFTAIDEQSYRKHALNYKDEVMKHLRSDQIDTILALCGRKFKLEDHNKKYFKEFYDFAKKRMKIGPKHGDGIYMCRIFVEVEDGKLAQFMDEEFKRHEKNRKYGVRGLTIKWESRNNLDSHVGPGFSKCLDEGFGFLLFYDTNGVSTVIIHEGTDHDMAFVVVTDELNVRGILEIYRTLCRESVQYEGTERTKLEKMLERLQLPVVP